MSTTIVDSEDFTVVVSDPTYTIEITHTDENGVTTIL